MIDQPQHSQWTFSAGTKEGTFDIHLPSSGTAIEIIATVHGLSNARLIITAVNAHVELLEAAKEIVAMVATRDVRSFVWGSSKVENLRAAIAKAEELPP